MCVYIVARRWFVVVMAAAVVLGGREMAIALGIVQMNKMENMKAKHRSRRQTRDT